MRAARLRRIAGAENGAAVVDFALIGGLLTVIFIAIVQLALTLHVRNTLIDAAASGARYGTLADRTPQDAVSRTMDLIAGTLRDGFAEDVSVRRLNLGGTELLQVTVRAPTPVIGFLGPAGTLEVSGHAAVP